MRNIWLKALSLLTALFFWYFVTTNVTTVTLSIPIEIKDTPPDKVIVSGSSPQAQVKISGPSFIVSSIAASPPAFKVRVAPDVKNRFVVVLRPDDLSLPSTVTIHSIEPQEFELTLDEKIARAVNIEVPRIGALDANVQLAEVNVRPRKVTVVGPRNEVEELAQVETYPVDLRGMKEDTTLEVKVRNPGPLTTVETEAVTVRFRVVPVEATRRFSDLPVEMRALDGAQFTLTPRSVSVEISGPRTAIAALKRDDIIPYARVSPSTVAGDKVTVACEVPREVHVLGIDPPQVTVGVLTPIATPTPTPTATPTVPLPVKEKTPVKERTKKR